MPNCVGLPCLPGGCARAAGCSLCAGPQLRALQRNQPAGHCGYQPDSGVCSGRADSGERRFAVDAAIAANAVLGVTEPMMTASAAISSCCTGCQNRKLTGLNSSGAAPRALSPNFWRSVASSACRATAFTLSPSRRGARWYQMHERYGSCPGKICSSRDCFAEQGYPVHEGVRESGRCQQRQRTSGQRRIGSRLPPRREASGDWADRPKSRPGARVPAGCGESPDAFYKGEIAAHP